MWLTFATTVLLGTILQEWKQSGCSLYKSPHGARTKYSGHRYLSRNEEKFLENGQGSQSRSWAYFKLIYSLICWQKWYLQPTLEVKQLQLTPLTNATSVLYKTIRQFLEKKSHIASMPTTPNVI